MKKNKMMRLASGLLVAVLLTTCAISGTFAKYTTQDSASDSARVAKWGVTVAASGSLYGEKYAHADNKITASELEDEVSVWGSQYATLNNVVAPGTASDEGFHFNINGKPEVDALVTLDIEHQNVFLAKGNYGVMIEVVDVTKDNFPATGLYTKTDDEYTLANAWNGNVQQWFELHDEAEVSNSEGYWPIIYTMTGGTNYNAGSIAADSLKSIAKAIIDKLDGSDPTQDNTHKSKYTYTNVTKSIEQNNDLNSVMNLGDIEISWAWAFENGSSDAEKVMYNGADTILGNLMAERINTEDWKGDVVKSTGTGKYGQLVEGTDYCLDTSFSISITVTQVD